MHARGNARVCGPKHPLPQSVSRGPQRLRAQARRDAPRPLHSLSARCTYCLACMHASSGGPRDWRAPAGSKFIRIPFGPSLAWRPPHLAHVLLPSSRTARARMHAPVALRACTHAARRASASCGWTYLLRPLCVAARCCRSGGRRLGAPPLWPAAPIAVGYYKGCPF